MNKQEGFQVRALAPALVLTLIALALAACDSAPPTVGVAGTSARPTPAPTQTQTPSPTPPRTSIANPAPATTPTLTPLPSPTPTHIPSATPTATPTPTPTPMATGREAVVAQLAETLPWRLSGNSADGPVTDALVDTWLCHPALAHEIVLMPWVVDGIEEGEYYALLKIENIACGHEALAEDLLTLRNSQDFDTLLWFVDVIVQVDAQLARRVLNLPWAVDGLTQPEYHVLSKLTGRIPPDGELIRRMLGMAWVTDGITKVESEAVDDLVSIWRYGETVRDAVFAFPWVLDGVTEAEEAGLWGISGISYSDQSLASEVMGSMSELLSLSGDLAVYALPAIGQIGEFPDDLKPLVALPWFADGLDPEEAAFVTTLVPVVYDDPRLYAELLHSRFSLSRTISLPLAGPVNLWVFQNAPFPEDEKVERGKSGPFLRAIYEWAGSGQVVKVQAGKSGCGARGRATSKLHDSEQF